MKVREIIQPHQNLNEGFTDDLFSSGLTTAIKNYMAPTGGRLDKSIKVGSRIRTGGVAILKLLGAIGVPIWNYNSNMLIYDKQLASKKITQDQFDQRHQYEMGMMVSLIASGMAVRFVGQAAITAIGYLVSAVPLVGYVFGPIIRVFSPELTLALMYYINTDKGRDIIAKLICASVLNNEKGMEFIGWNALKISINDVKEMVAKVVKMSKEEIAELTGQDKPADPTAPVQPDPTKPADPTAPVQPGPTKPTDPNAPVQPGPAEPEVDPASYANTNVPGSRYTDTTRFKRNAKGELILL